MTIDELLREAAPDHDRLRARMDGLRADVLARATARPRRPVRRPVRAGLAAAVVATVGVGGVAYASGSAPPWLSDLVDQFGDHAGVPAAERPEMTQTVDLELPDGSRFAAWRGLSEEMWCTNFVDQWDGRSFDNGRGTCSDDGPASYELHRIKIEWARGNEASTYYPVLWGHAYDGAVEVRVRGRFAATGDRVDLTLPVDPDTGAFAGVLPGTRDQPYISRTKIVASKLTLDFIDAAGRAVRTVDAPPA